MNNEEKILNNNNYMGMEFEKIKNIEELISFLENPSERYFDQDDVNLLHYTDINSALSIIQSRKLILGNYYDMNDLFEKELIERSDKKGRLFFSSFSRENESLAMYKMYGENDSTVILNFPKSCVLGIIGDLPGVYKGGIDDDSANLSSYVRNVSIIRKGEELEKRIRARVFLLDVVYLNPFTNDLHFDGQVNDSIIAPLSSDKLIGAIKYACWEYEKETRLCALALDEGEVFDRIVLELPNDLCNHIRVTLGPGFNKEKYYSELVELRRQGVVWQNSVYDGFYKDSTKNNRQSYYINTVSKEEYLGYSFSGKDPWGGFLSIRVKSVNRCNVVIDWFNSFSDYESEQDVNFSVTVNINSDLIGHFDIDEKLPIGDDKNEYLHYLYNGAIQFIEKKVLVSFISGNTSYHVLGGAGVLGYGDGGSGRMGMEQMVILLREEK